jgi:hypothetical protein
MQDDDLYMVVYSVILYTTLTWCVLHRLVYSLIPSMHIFDFFPNRSRLDSIWGENESQYLGTRHPTLPSRQPSIAIWFCKQWYVVGSV